MADRIGSRDPGNKPAINDRIPYIYIKLDKIDDTTLQGDRIENPEYIIEKSLIPDYLHYITNQIMKPVLQLYALSLEELPNYDKENDYWKKIDTELKLKPFYQDHNRRKNRIDNLRLKLVKELLFDKFINLLSEPKIKKIKKKEKTSINEKSINDNINLKKLLNNEKFHVDLKVIKPLKSPENTIDIKFKIIKDNKTVIENNNTCISNKKKEIINTIILLIEYFEKNEINDIIYIKLNNKLFLKDYKKAVIDYKEFVKYENIDNNLVINAIDTNDTGMLKNALIVTEYEKLLLNNHKFEFI